MRRLARHPDSDEYNVKYMIDHYGEYFVEYLEGREAEPLDVCPYGESEIGKRCAWIGGKNDARSE